MSPKAWRFLARSQATGTTHKLLNAVADTSLRSLRLEEFRDQLASDPQISTFIAGVQAVSDASSTTQLPQAAGIAPTPAAIEWHGAKENHGERPEEADSHSSQRNPA